MNSTEPTPTEATPGQVARLVREHVLDEVADFIHGATFDGRKLVLAAGYRLFRIVPTSGRVVDQLETFPERGGLAYGGRHVWQHSEGRIEQLEPRTGSVLRSLSPALGEMTGLECIGHDLLLLHAAGRRLARVETLDAASIADVEVSVPLRGLAWVGPELWSSTAGSLCHIDPASGQVVAQVALPAGIEVCDLAADDEGLLWCVDGRSRLVRAFVNRRTPSFG